MKQNPIPYYTLKQATKILNEKFKTSIYDSKSILTMALHYKIDLYVLFLGNWEISCDCYVPINLSMNEEDENKVTYRKIVLDIESIIESWIERGALLKLCATMLFDLLKRGECSSFSMSEIGFIGVIPIKDIFQNPSINFIKDIILSNKSSYPIPLSKEEVHAIEIYAIYPTINQASIFQDNIPNAVDYGLYPSVTDEEYNIEDGYFNYPKIGKKEVLITHIQLEKIINGELKSRWDSKEICDMNSEQINSIDRRGVSIAKSNAKLAAKTLAQYLWTKDADQNIKLLEMARNVSKELQKTEHQSQLPSVESIKEWLKPIAPLYAKQAGRPQEIND